MKLDIRTLVFILSLTCIAQVIALFIQYRVNRIYRGIGWWLIGSLSMATGFIALSMGAYASIAKIAVLGNPLLILGRMCLLIGTIKFIEKRINLFMTYGSVLIFIVIYYYYLFGHESIAARTMIVSTAISIYSMTTAYCLIFKARKGFAGSAKFTGTVFLFHGTYLIILILFTLFSHPIRTYVDYSPIQVAAFIVPTITSTLWTFGFILMVNQRLTSEILEEKENLQRIFNTGPDASIISRWNDGVIVDVNMGFSTISGYAREEVIGQSTIGVNVWHNSSDREYFINTIKTNECCENLEFDFRRKDGSLFIGMISARTISIHGQPFIISVVRDITKQKTDEEALRESEETYRSILKASPDDITITDLEGRILLVSPAANVMFGYGPDEGQDLRIHDFIVPEDVERAQANIKRMYQGGQPGPNEYRAVRKDGSMFHIEVNSGLIRGLTGQPTKMVFVVRDISERKQADAEKARLEAQNRQLQKAESLGRMAGAIAHHFNNKLQSVMANLELIEGHSKGTDPSHFLSLAKQATEGAAAVSRQMLVYLGQASDQRDPQPLSRVCQDALALLQGEQRGVIPLVAAWPSPGPVVSANAGQVQQVLSNLVSNAREAMGEGKDPIHLGLSTCRAADIPTTHRFPIDWQPQEVDHACLEVADAGTGIAEADFEKLFDPFFSTKFSGRGLGLPVVLGIVQAHGGAVVVDSEPGRGSTFRVYLPISREAVPDLVERPVPASEPERGGTVLLVDDDEFLLASTGAMIEMIGFTVLTAGDGVEAVEVFQRHRADIRAVITDLTMPRMDGWETLSTLRQLAPTLPVILSSGYDKAQIMRGAHAEHPQGFLGKPYTLRQLQEVLASALAGG